MPVLLSLVGAGDPGAAHSSDLWLVGLAFVLVGLIAWAQLAFRIRSARRAAKRRHPSSPRPRAHPA